jgi:K+-sensing histidine kinase KdpD
MTLDDTPGRVPGPREMKLRALLSHDRFAVLVALVGPLAVSAALVPIRESVANANVALVLVLVIVAVAGSGTRVAGVLAALSSSLWFDLFLTRPYGRFTITNRADLGTTALLLAVGVGVTELALWGRRQHENANREAGYLAGIRAAAEAVATGGSSADLIVEVTRQLTRLFDLCGSAVFSTASRDWATLLGCATTEEWSGIARSGTSTGRACRLTSTSNCLSRAADVCRAGSCSALRRTRTPRWHSGSSL